MRCFQRNGMRWLYDGFYDTRQNATRIGDFHEE
jgi:hypothetical protein